MANYISQELNNKYIAYSVMSQLKKDIETAVKQQIDTIIRDAVSQAIDSINIDYKAYSMIDPSQFGEEIRVMINVSDSREKKYG